MTPEEKLAYNAQLGREQYQSKQVRRQQIRDRQIPSLEVQSWDSDRQAYRATAPDGTVRYVAPLTNGAIAAGDAVRSGLSRIDAMPRKHKKIESLIIPVTTGLVKVLFSAINGENRDFYIGGDRLTPIKIWSTPVATELSEVYISNTGKSLNSWIVSIRSGNSYYSITPSGVVETGNVPGNTRLSYRGHGLWSSGLIIGFTQREWVEANSSEIDVYNFNPSVYTVVSRTRTDATGTTFESTRTPAEPDPPTNTFIYSEGSTVFSASYVAAHSFLSASVTYGGSGTSYEGSSPFRSQTFSKTITQSSETVDLWLNKDGLNATPKGSASDTGNHESFYSVDQFDDSTAVFDYVDTVSATANGSTILSQSGTLRAFSGSQESQLETHQTGTDAYVSHFSGFPGRSFDVPPLNNYNTTRTEYQAYLSGKANAIAFKQSRTNNVNNADRGYYLIEDELEYKFQNSLPFVDFASTNLVGRKITFVSDRSSYKNKNVKTPVEVHQISVVDGVANVGSSQEKPTQVFSLRSPDCTVHSASAYL